MQIPISIDILNYRSIKDECAIPFKNKTTIAIGQNNSGKSNILKAIAAIFNKSYGTGDENYRYRINIKNEHFKSFAESHQHLRLYSGQINEEITLVLKEKRVYPEKVPSNLLQYLRTNGYYNDFGRTSNHELDIRELYSSIFSHASDSFNGSIYVPNIRYITNSGREPENFSKSVIAGEVIQYGNIITNLSSLNHPTTQNRVEGRKQFAEIEDFLAFCLDKKSVKIEIPYDQSTIHVDIGGEEHPIQDLGTGIEQLLIIGLASFGFPKKIVLVDEPELHFHPRAQKRMVQYLNENVDAHFVFATHSAAILDAVEADVLQVTHDGKKSIVNTVSSNKARYDAVRDLGHSPSDLLLTRYAIWVEGPSDRLYLNHWISKNDPHLKEGIDYTILFYGGKILSHHSFEEVENEMVKAFSLCREFALLMDSDINKKRSRINATKTRIKEEVERQNGLCWITDGREIENYIPINVVESLGTKHRVTIPKSKFEQIITEKKTEFAKEAIKLLESFSAETYEWPYDLKSRINDLANRIKSAR